MAEITVSFQYGLMYGSILTVLMTLFIFTTLKMNPEIWVGDAPEDIQKHFGPLSDRAKRVRTIWAIPLFATLTILVVWAIVSFRQQSAIEVGFVPLFFMLFVMMMTFNIWDLLIIDWLIVVSIQPKWVILPGTEGLAGYKDYAFHFRAFLKGSAGIFIASLVIAGIVMLFV